MLMSVIQPMVETIRNVLRFLIVCQQSEFKDVSPVATLLKVSFDTYLAPIHELENVNILYLKWLIQTLMEKFRYYECTFG